MHRDDHDEAREFKYFAHAFARLRQRQLATGRADALGRDQQHAQPGAADVAEGGKLEQHALAARPAVSRCGASASRKAGEDW
jgi:hypothetical protein